MYFPVILTMTPFMPKIKQHTLPVKTTKKQQEDVTFITKTKYYYNQHKWIINFKT